MTNAANQLDWYNGWSPAERLSSPMQNAAVRDGVIPRPTRCSICGDEDHRTWRSSVWFHDEDYRRPLEAYPICKRCHIALHRRFDEPALWLTLVARHARSGAWFEALTIDPASLRRPFDETYPNGLPPR